MKKVTTFFWGILMSASLAPLYGMDPTPEPNAQKMFIEHKSTSHKIAESSEELAILLMNGAADVSYVTSPIIGVWVLTLLALKSLESAQKSEQKSLRHYLKDYLIENVGVPMYIAYDRIKREGLSKKDFAAMGVALLVLYGAKKSADRYHLGTALRGDLASTRESLSQDAGWLWNHKGRIALGLGTLGILGLLIKSALNLPIMERFKRSLTSQQKEIISSDKALLELMDKAHENPAALIDHDHFTVHLHEHQKELLGKAVEKYRNEADPLSLFDDFVMNSEETHG